jgi:small-conductance mechanosensitive channel
MMLAVAEGFFTGMERVLNYPLLKLGETPVTLSLIITTLLLLGLVIVGERMLRRYFVLRLLRKTKFEPSLQYAISRIVGYLVLLLGFYIVLQVVGVNLSSLAVIAGAIGVGLGFGLQNIINNFVSGLIILAERHISVGDRIVVGGVDGRVEKISLRSTTVTTSDNIAIIVPNADLIANSVTNWGYGDSKVRFRVPVGIAYGSDIERFRRLMLQVAADYSKALKDPPPEVFFTGFGDSALNFELAVWTKDMVHAPTKFRSELLYAMEKKLRENNVEIPFPQRDLRLRLEDAQALRERLPEKR